MGQERFQSHERKTWAIGGTGVITGCVRDLTRSEAILEREQQDLAFEVCVCVCVRVCVCV